MGRTEVRPSAESAKNTEIVVLSGTGARLSILLRWWAKVASRVGLQGLGDGGGGVLVKER